MDVGIHSDSVDFALGDLHIKHRYFDAHARVLHDAFESIGDGPFAEDGLGDCFDVAGFSFVEVTLVD